MGDPLAARFLQAATSMGLEQAGEAELFWCGFKRVHGEGGWFWLRVEGQSNPGRSAGRCRGADQWVGFQKGQLGSGRLVPTRSQVRNRHAP